MCDILGTFRNKIRLDYQLSIGGSSRVTVNLHAPSFPKLILEKILATTDLTQILKTLQVQLEGFGLGIDSDSDSVSSLSSYLKTSLSQIQMVPEESRTWTWKNCG